MPHGVLFDPSNRLLGRATDDFSLYGAQSAVTIGPVAPPATDPTLLTIPVDAAPRSAPGPAHVADDADASDLVDAKPIPVDEMAAPPPPGATLQSAPPSIFDFQTLAPHILAPAGLGEVPATTSAAAAFPVASRAPDAVIAQSVADAAPALTQGLSATSLAAPVLALADAPVVPTAILAPAATLAVPVLDGIDGTVGTVVSPIENAAAGTAALLDGVASDAAEAQATVGAVADAVVEPIADTVAAAAAATVDTLTGAVPTTLAPAIEGVATAASAADNVAAATPVVEQLAGTVAAADLTGATGLDAPFGGTDPDGGVTTLVSMVETDAVFEIGLPAPTGESAASEPTIDTLLSDEAPSSLLGDAADKATDDLLSDHDSDDGVHGLL